MMTSILFFVALVLQCSVLVLSFNGNVVECAHGEYAISTPKGTKCRAIDNTNTAKLTLESPEVQCQKREGYVMSPSVEPDQVKCVKRETPIILSSATPTLAPTVVETLASTVNQCRVRDGYYIPPTVSQSQMKCRVRNPPSEGNTTNCTPRPCRPQPTSPVSENQTDSLGTDSIVPTVEPSAYSIFLSRQPTSITTNSPSPTTTPSVNDTKNGTSTGAWPTEAPSSSTGEAAEVSTSSVGSPHTARRVAAAYAVVAILFVLITAAYVVVVLGMGRATITYICNGCTNSVFNAKRENAAALGSLQELGMQSMEEPTAAAAAAAAAAGSA